MPARRLPARDLALVAVFAALIAAMGLAPPLYVFGSPVPITLQTLGVMLAGAVLGARRGALAVLVLLALVAAGLPLLSGGRGGLAVFAGPTAGYLVGWPIGAAVVGWLAERRPARGVLPWMVAACAIGGIGVVYLFGIPVSAFVTGTSGVLATAVAALVYLPGDALKALVAGSVAVAVHRGYPVLGPPRRLAARR